MPRKWIETIRPWPKLKGHDTYRCRVLDVQKSDAPPGIVVELEHLNAPNVGRRHSILLPLPMRPEGLGPQFFRACGEEVAEGARLAPRDVIGSVIAVCFERSENARPTPTSFAANPETPTQPQEETHGNTKD